MKLLDKPLSHKERDDMHDLLKGNICRVCVSDDPEEIIRHLGFAIDRLSMLAYSRIKEIKEKEIDDFLKD